MKKTTDWAGFVDINAVKSGQESVLKMEAYPEEADALYLVTRDPMNARQSTEHFIGVFL